MGTKQQNYIAFQESEGAGKGGKGIHTSEKAYSLSQQKQWISGAVSSKWAKGSGGPAGDEAYNLLVWEMAHADEAVREGGDIAPTLQQRMGTGGNQVPLVGVRRLTPTECERLQGFPDGHTAWGIDENGNRKEQSDTARYRQLGNAVAVPVVEWLGRRIMAVSMLK